MTFEIIETSIRFHLYGFAAEVENKGVGEVGLKLMNELWKVVKESKTATTGINHWVYLPGNQMFVGVELAENAKALRRAYRYSADSTHHTSARVQ